MAVGTRIRAAKANIMCQGRGGAMKTTALHRTDGTGIMTINTSRSRVGITPVSGASGMAVIGGAGTITCHVYNRGIEVLAAIEMRRSRFSRMAGATSTDIVAIVQVVGVRT